MDPDRAAERRRKRGNRWGPPPVDMAPAAADSTGGGGPPTPTTVPPMGDHATGGHVTTTTSEVPPPPPPSNGDGAAGAVVPTTHRQPPGPYAVAVAPAPAQDATGGGGGGDGATEASFAPKKRRRTRWEPQEVAAAAGRVAPAGAPFEPTPFNAGAAANAGGSLVLPGGLQVQLPATLLGEQSAPPDATPEVRAKFKELANINRRMLAGLPFDERSERSRSPSPEPVYDQHGVRLNTRDVLDKERFHTRRMALVEELVEICPGFRPPPDYRPVKKQRKILIPVADHPGYNFFGLIIGGGARGRGRLEVGAFHVFEFNSARVSTVKENNLNAAFVFLLLFLFFSRHHHHH